MKSSQCSNGVLDPTSEYGRATITEYVVLNVLGDCAKEKLNAPYDLTSKKYGTINVKSSKICTNNNIEFWTFYKKTDSFVPDYYVCIGFSKYCHVIQRVWIIPSDSPIVRNGEIIIKKNEHGLTRAKPYEVDSNPFNIAFESFDNLLYPEFCNIDKREFKNKQLNYVKPDRDQTIYEEYLRYIEEYEFPNLAFDPENGNISVSHNIWVIPLTDETYPVFNYKKEYLGFMDSGTLVKITPLNKKKVSMYFRILEMVKSLTEYNGKADFSYMLDKYETSELNNYLEEMCNKKEIRKCGEYDYIYINKEG